MIFNKTGNIKKDSSGIRRILPLPGVTASVRPIGLTSRQPPAIQTKDSFGIVEENTVILSVRVDTTDCRFMAESHPLRSII